MTVGDSLKIPAPHVLAEQIADLLPRGVNVYQVGAVRSVADFGAHDVCWPMTRATSRDDLEISGSGDDIGAAVVALHNAAERFEVTP